MRNKLQAAATIDRYWCIDPVYATSAEELLLTINADDMSYAARNSTADREYEIVDGVAYIPMAGPMTKAETSMMRIFGGCSTVSARRMIRAADADRSISRIVLMIDSPGGQVSGTAELADTVTRTRKPIIAYVEDMCCSAAYWVAAQCDEIIASPHALAIGSIGVFTVLYDTSEAYSDQGVKTILISSGGVKGHVSAGVAIPDDVIEDRQSQVDRIHQKFTDAVIAGRPALASSVIGYATGHVWDASEAQTRGLVDRLASLDDVQYAWSEQSASAMVDESANSCRISADKMKNILRWFKGDESAADSNDTNTQAATDPTKIDDALALHAREMQAIAANLADQRVESAIDKIRSEKKLTQPLELAFAAAYEAAIKADGGGMPLLKNGSLYTGEFVDSIDAIASALPVIPLGEATLSGVTEVVVIHDASNVTDQQRKAKGREAMAKATPGTLKKATETK